jgi:hypothetical protein
VKFDFPSKIRSVAIYESSLETREKEKVRLQPKFQRIADDRIAVRWSKRHIREGQSFRFE